MGRGNLHLATALFVTMIIASGFVDFKPMPAITKDTTSCPFENMARISTYWGSYCIDQYEAHRSGGKAGSASGKDPWVNIKWNDAKAKCEAVGKHLCRDYEWMAACNLQGQKYDLTNEENQNDETYGCYTVGASKNAKTGTQSECRSDAGVYDMIGNVAEWTDALVPDSSWAGEHVPVGTLLDEPIKKYGDDFLYWKISSKGNPFHRGGSRFSGTTTKYSPNSGCFMLSLNSAPSVRRATDGFRCCSD